MNTCKLTQEQREWVRNIAPISYTKEMTLLLNETFSCNITYKELQNFCSKRNIKTLSSVYSMREIEIQCRWLYENKYEIKTLTDMYNVQFGCTISVEDLARRVANNNYTYLKIFGDKYKELCWLRENAPKYTVNELTRQFNKHFNKNVHHSQVTHYCEKINAEYIKRESHYYTQEEIDWMSNNYTNYLVGAIMDWDKMLDDFNKKFNSNVQNCRSLQSAFYTYQDKRLDNKHLIQAKATEISKKFNTKKIGDITIYHKQHYIKIKDGLLYDDCSHTSNIKNYYRKKSHILYEEYHNIKIDDNKYIVMHLDNNYNNFDKDNLYLISRLALNIYKGMNLKNESIETKINTFIVCEILALTKE